MRKLFSFILTALILTVSYSYLHAAIPPIVEITAPIATPHPGTVNPFINAVDVSLDLSKGKGSKLDIYYDLNNKSPLLDITKALVFEKQAIHLTETTILRTTACSSSTKICGDTAIYQYVKAQAPIITLTAPASGSSYQLGQAIAFLSNVTNPDGRTLTVSYQKKLLSATTFDLLGTGSAIGQGFPFSWTPATPGSYLIRAVAADPLLQGVSPEITVNVIGNQGPSINWISPITGSTYTGPATFTATVTASDSNAASGGGISKVEFYQDGVLQPTTLTAAPWNYTFTSIANGTHTYFAKVYDNNSPIAATATSATITILVNTINQPPEVSFVNPLTNSFYFTPATDSIRISATDDVSVTKVILYKNNIAIDTLKNAPYGYRWKELNSDVNTYHAVAYDNLGLTTQSTPLKLKTAVNLPPKISIPADTTILLTANSFVLKPTAMDPDTIGASTLYFNWSATPENDKHVSFNPNPNTLKPTVSLAANGVFPLTFKATDSMGAATSGTMNVTVWSLPVINSTLNVSTGTGIPFNYAVAATGFPAQINFTAKGPNGTNIPAWLTWDAATGKLTGTPTVSGNVSVTLTAQNLAGTDTKTLNISISDTPVKPTLTSVTSTMGKINSNFGFNLNATGTNPITFKASGLPPGLSLAPATGAITGMPTAAGNYTVGIAATNAIGKDSTNLIITVKSPPTITLDLPDTVTLFVKSAYTYIITANGFPSLKFQWESSSISDPSGNFNIIGGNAADFKLNNVGINDAGKFRVKVINDTGSVYSKTSVLIVKPIPAPIIITASPVKVSTVIGSLAILKVKATGAPILKYQWFKNSVPVTPQPLPGDSDLVFPVITSNDAGVYRARVTNSFSDTNNATSFAWSDTARISVISPQLPVPKATPPGGSFTQPTAITLTNDTAGTEIYYTLNVSGTPTQSSPKYIPGQTVITIDTNIVLRAKAYKAGFRASDVMVENYSYAKPSVVFQPTIYPANPTFTSSINCSLSTATPGAEIWYTLDGTDPRGAVNSITNFPRKFTGGIALSSTTTVIAFAKANGMTSSDTINRIYTYIPPPIKAQPPNATPAGADFNQSINVVLNSGTDSPQIWYTTDGSSPDTSTTKSLYTSTGLTFIKTTNLRAIVQRVGYLKSEQGAWKFTLIPLITASPASGIVFDASLKVKLSVTPKQAVIRYTTNGVAPDALTSPIYDTAAGLTLTGTTTITAIATFDGITTKASAFSYTLKNGQLATPISVTAINGNEFKDSLKVSLQATNGANIFYTLDGKIPTPNSSKYSQPIKIDTTTTIQAIAVQAGFETSQILFVNYFLEPESPTISPVGGNYVSTQKVTLSSSSKKAKLYYTLDGSEPNAFKSNLYTSGIPIEIKHSLQLKAIAVAGSRVSPVHEETYYITGIRDTTLKPGETFYLEGGLAFANPDGQNAKVNIKLAAADTLKLIGFDGVQSRISLSLVPAISPNPTSAFPKMVFTFPSSEKRSLYKIDATGKVYFLTSRDSVTLDEAGIYFMGFDTLPPNLKYVTESIESDDSTQIKLSIEDNVTNITYQLKRNDDTTLNTQLVSIKSPANLSFKFKHKKGILKPLLIQVRAGDYRFTTFLPENQNSWLSLSQSLSAFTGPPKWNIGLNSESPYDFIGIPLNLNPSLTLGALSQLAEDPNLQGVTWDVKDSIYKQLLKNDEFKPGQGYWIASRKRLSNLSMPSAKTEPLGKSEFTLRLHHGWNQVANPQMEKLYWPIPRDFPEVYRSSFIKGLWSYDASKILFEEVEFLEPWRGYYVYNYANDTSITLSIQPITNFTLNKQSSSNFLGRKLDPNGGSSIVDGVSDEMTVAMGWGTGKSIRLGAALTANEGIGIEDELPLPQAHNQFSLEAIRKGRALSTDWIKLVKDQVLEWKIAMNGHGDSLPQLQILEHRLPAGYETWAVSKSRKMKFKVVTGEQIPASGLDHDTLQILSGPKMLLAKMSALQGLSLHVPELQLNLLTHQGGFIMQISLPTQVKITAQVWSLDGKNKGEMIKGPLSEGAYQFHFQSDFRHSQSQLNPGIYFLTLELHGTALNSRISRKLIIGD